MFQKQTNLKAVKSPSRLGLCGAWTYIRLVLIRSPSTELDECYGRACSWQTRVQSHCPRPVR